MLESQALQKVFIIAGIHTQRVFAPAVSSAFPEAKLFCLRTIEDAERKAEMLRAPILALMEVPESAGTAGDMVRRFHHRFESVPLVLIAPAVDRACVVATLRAGARGYLPKTTPLNVTIAALHLVVAGGSYVPPEVWYESTEAPHEPAALADQLTERKGDVLRLLLKGRSNSNIAAELNIAEGTVKQHIHSIYKRIGVSTRAELMARAVEGRIRRDGSPIPQGV